MELQNRKSTRLKNFDYNTSGKYFITICVKGRKSILSNIIVGTGVLDCPKTELLYHGKIADKYINQLNNFYNNISVDKYVIMPDHIHLLLSINNVEINGQSRTPVPTNINNVETNGQSGTPVPTNTNNFEKINNTNSAVSKFVSTFKRFCNKEYDENIWQARYYDHVIRNETDYKEILEYIENNPLKKQIKTDS